MLVIIALIPAIPFLSFLILALLGNKMSRKVAGIIGAGSIGIIAILTFIIAIVFFKTLPEVKSYSANIWEWINAGNLKVNISFSLDALSLVFCFVITFVGFLIHIYSIGFMEKDEGSQDSLHI